MYRRVIKPALFRLDAEDAHHLTVNALALMSRLPGWPAAARRLSAPADSRLMQTLWGHTYASPVGLAAGLDKNGVAVPAFSALGFGFVEVGTVTPQPQPGNDRPRLFRLPPDEALINRMGFNNAGAAALRGQLSRLGRRTVPVWVNIGKNKLTEEAAQDYVACVQELYDVADAFVVNVSSPNTPGLRALQASAELEALLRAVLNETEAQRLRTARRAPPVLVKLAPDLHPADFEASVQGALNAGVQGLIVSNTTLSRDGLTHAHREQAGGLSGRPLTGRSTALVQDAYRLTRGAVPVVGVGGIFSADDAYAKIRAGASLVEVYSSLIYEGPGLPARIHRGLGQLLERDGISHVRDAVGADA
ncbi:quinone-dependent dihydroorotate dehydrogenase [Deinococcus deserti]|uniref:Dihydroorotate dehydrogenase (quinone) n=1 Tax=Deinococcus deserti (strain DSM 17065 / CIP 109153 / LMG 22923 / VCD115) TaxID=546414 RepID=PYRD_DEIDV|nr:quinone-dependent dihydroorotate dehydrogenase [Deinococcus deserti]C1CX89.1 RecName: Full=Dihydroorotate dehydrogenase (quinone); AltName: Full=DHOdehase; Short=DHOD; Short=DHODase; AltName: Full=Dihydroorotate oxidase [Deinococcus deserti VCD115]ACO46806.1 putative bifunctional protein: dihydroorotate oxidase (dihydroorotate dehydrogenase)/dihydropyrimidine dehydrogenase (NADP(+)) [Deinococcus deserti VCD115]